MRDRRPCSKCGTIQCFKHCNNCGANILWRPPELSWDIPYVGPKPLNIDGTTHDRCYSKSKGVGPGERDELSFSMQLFQFLTSSFNPVIGKFMGPHKTLAQLKVMKYNARAAPPRIAFKDAFPKLCYICGEYYSVVNRDCPVCYDLTELGVPSPRPGVEHPVFGFTAMIEWAKSKNKKIPLYLIMRTRKQDDGENQSVRSIQEESCRKKESSQEKEKSEKVKHAWKVKGIHKKGW